ncbi:hypothetical protein NHJ13734_007386 [Beauveria thailandica]
MNPTSETRSSPQSTCFCGGLARKQKEERGPDYLLKINDRIVPRLWYRLEGVS